MSIASTWQESSHAQIELSNSLSSAPNKDHMQRLWPREVDCSTNHLGATKFMMGHILGLVLYFMPLGGFMIKGPLASFYIHLITNECNHHISSYRYSYHHSSVEYGFHWCQRSSLMTKEMTWHVWWCDMCDEVSKSYDDVLLIPWSHCYNLTPFYKSMAIC